LTEIKSEEEIERYKKLLKIDEKICEAFDKSKDEVKEELDPRLVRIIQKWLQDIAAKSPPTQ
jgi:hypothetical protein